MSTKRWLDVLEQAASLGCLTLRITGGEPLLRDDFSVLYTHARKLGMKVALFTNATLLNPEIVDLLVRIPPLEIIEVTLYGLHRKSYEAVSRNPGSFAAAMEGVDRLLGGNIPFIVKGTVLPPNKNERREFEGWARKIPWLEGKPPFVFLYELHHRRDEVKNRRIRNLRLSPEEALRILTRDRAAFRADRRDCFEELENPEGDVLFQCGAGTDRLTVDAYGRIQACTALRHPDTVFDLKTGSLGQAVSDFFPELIRRKALNPEYLERCARCFIRLLCDFCPARSWAEYGILDRPDHYSCRMAHAQARRLGLLGEGEKSWEVTDGTDRVARFCEEKE